MIVLNSSEVWSRWVVRSVVVAPSSRACPARNWRFAVVGAGFEEVTLLDAVRARSSCSDVSVDSWGVYWSCLNARRAVLSKSAV